jgi:acetyl-CoA carboxylase carboxyltransferase component
MQEGLAALAGYARIFKANVELSGKVPQISVICGASAGGGSYSPALTDFVVMTEKATMFLTGPQVVRDVMGEDVDAFELGGPKVHERNGVAHFVARSDADAALLVRDLLDHLPASRSERAPRWRPADAPGYSPGSRCGRGEEGLRRARGRARDRRRRPACSSMRRAGRATSSAGSPASTGARSA